MATAGALGIQITADDAELRAVMRRAAEATVTAFGTMEGSAKQFKSVLEALGVATTVGGILAFARSAIDSAAALDDLAEKTGASVEELSKLNQVARISGLGIETVEMGLIRLAKALGGADEESKGAGQAFAKLGLDMEKLRGMDTADALKLVSAELNKYADGQGKTALALDIFGKSGAQLLPLLKDLGDAGNVNARVTAAQAAEAETLQNTFNKLAGDALDLKRALVLELVPGLQQVAEYFKSSKAEAASVGDSFNPVTETFKAVAVVGANVAFVFKGIGREIGGIVAQAAALANGDTAGFSAISDALKSDGEKARKELDDFEKGILRFDKLAKQRADALAKLTDKDLDARDLRNRLPKLDYKSTSGRESGDDPAKKLLDNRLKALEGASQTEKDIVTSTFKAIEIVAGQNLISFRDYYDVRRTIQENAVKKQQENYDAEIAALQDFKKKAAKETDRTEAQGKIDDIRRKKIALDRTAADQVDEDTEKQRKAFKDLENQIKLNNASVLELEGNLGEAAKIRFDVANQDIRARFVVEGREDAVALLDTLKGYSVAQAEVNALNAEADRIGQQRANTETLIGIAQRNGAITELGSLQARTQARLKEIEDLEKIYETRLKIAQESGNPKLLQDAENLRVRLEELRSSADLLGQAFDNIFVSSAADAFSSFISGAKSAKEAFRDFVNSVVQQISKLAAQDLANALFKGGNSSSGQGGGFFGFLGSLFGSGGGSGFTNQTAGGSFTLPGEGWAKGGTFDGARRFANGGMFTNGIVDSPTYFNPAVMGEAGPEAIMPLARDGSGRLGVRGGGGGNQVNVTFNISTPDAGSFRASESQIAARMHAAVQSGLRNR